ncbi:thymocyte nuclear protein 1-like isoform X1 [Pomacea canaliculata]|uniref:thymocyte nuclear protein 1-like isoform X1 n=1 Tax=Pomacea canaliculata TaxID=400727 RepID=UPI000D73DA90|nr:thymocyte nuclear protein 1-like isoform X1 [Pomacea canaliculata]
MPPRKKRKTVDVERKLHDKQSEVPPKSTKRSRGKDDQKTISSDSSARKLVYTHWLLKSEPDSRIENGVDMKFSFDDLKNRPNQTEHWDGVRNYQARNFLRDEIKEGHEVFFYHSNCKEPGIIGICQVVKSGYPDHTQFEKENPHFDSSSKHDNPKWYMVDVKYKSALDRFVSLSELKSIHMKHVKDGGPLQNMALFTRARLSVQPVSQDEWDFIINLSKTSL